MHRSHDVGRPMCDFPQLGSPLTMTRYLKLFWGWKAINVALIDLQCHVMSSVTCPFDSHLCGLYRWSIKDGKLHEMTHDSWLHRNRPNSRLHHRTWMNDWYRRRYCTRTHTMRTLYNIVTVNVQQSMQHNATKTLILYRYHHYRGSHPIHSSCDKCGAFLLIVLLQAVRSAITVTAELLVSRRTVLVSGSGG